MNSTVGFRCLTGVKNGTIRQHYRQNNKALTGCICFSYTGDMDFWANTEIHLKSSTHIPAAIVFQDKIVKTLWHLVVLPGAFFLILYCEIMNF